MPEDIVSEVLRRALAVCQPHAGLVVHSDQDSQYWGGLVEAESELR